MRERVCDGERDREIEGVNHQDTTPGDSPFRAKRDTLNGCDDFCLQAKARIWTRLSYVLFSLDSVLKLLQELVTCSFLCIPLCFPLSLLVSLSITLTLSHCLSLSHTHTHSITHTLSHTHTRSPQVLKHMETSVRHPVAVWEALTKVHPELCIYI